MRALKGSENVAVDESVLKPGQSEIDKVGQIEQNDLIPIALKHRHGHPKDLYAMWIGSNTNYVVMLTGSLLIGLGLGFWPAVFAVILGNLLGCSVLGMSSIMGPRTGSSGILTSRTSFGQLGSYLPILISTISVLGWFSINSVVSTMGLQEILVKTGIPDSLTLMWICLFIVLAGEIILAIYGHATILKAEMWLAFLLGAVFIIFFFFLLPHMDWSYTGSLVEGNGVTKWGTWLLGMGLVFSYPLSWTNFASDYSRYFEPDVDSKKVAFYAGAGQFTALTLTEFIGIIFGVVATITLGGIGDDPVSQVPQLLPTWFFFFFMLAVVIGSMATNVPNGYTAGLSLLALRLPITRVQGVLIIAVFTLIFRIVTLLYGQFFTLYEDWLSYIIFWTCPWITVVLVDFWLRKGNYNTIDLMKWGKGGTYWYSGGVMWAGVISFVAGISSAFLFMNSALHVSNITTKYLGGADLSYFISILVAGLLFYLLARNHPTYEKARNMGHSIFPENDEQILAVMRKKKG